MTSKPDLIAEATEFLENANWYLARVDKDKYPEEDNYAFDFEMAITVSQLRAAVAVLTPEKAITVEQAAKVLLGKLDDDVPMPVSVLNLFIAQYGSVHPLIVRDAFEKWLRFIAQKDSA